MTDTVHEQWEKELRVLLGKIEAHPSADLEDERKRAVVLQTLLAEREKVPNP